MLGCLSANKMAVCFPMICSEILRQKHIKENEDSFSNYCKTTGFPFIIPVTSRNKSQGTLQLPWLGHKSCCSPQKQPWVSKHIDPMNGFEEMLQNCVMAHAERISCQLTNGIDSKPAGMQMAQLPCISVYVCSLQTAGSHWRVYNTHAKSMVGNVCFIQSLDFECLRQKKIERCLVIVRHPNNIYVSFYYYSILTLFVSFLRFTTKPRH